MSDPASEQRIVRETGLARELARIAEPVIEDLGFRLVRVVVSGRDGGTVQIMAERRDGGLGIDDCATISNELSPVFDAADAFPDRTNLEISSPGIDRPLVRLSDFDQWDGYEAKIELRQPVDGRKRLRGMLDGVEDGEVRLALEDKTDSGEAIVIGIEPDMIETAKLVASDALMEASLRRRKQNETGN